MAWWALPLGMPFSCSLLLGGLSLPVFVAVTFSGDGKFSKVYHPGGR